MGLYDGMTELEIRIVEELSKQGGRTYGEIAEAVGISERQLFRYRQKPYIRKAVRELVIQSIEDDLPDVMGSLRRNAKKGHYQSQELIAKMMGLLVNKHEVNQKTTIENGNFNDMTHRDIDEELKSLENELKVIRGGSAK